MKQMRSAAHRVTRLGQSSFRMVARTDLVSGPPEMHPAKSPRRIGEQCFHVFV